MSDTARLWWACLSKFLNPIGCRVIGGDGGPERGVGWLLKMLDDCLLSSGATSRSAVLGGVKEEEGNTNVGCG